MKNEEYININKIADAKGLKSTRSLRLEINKLESKYISRGVKVNGGTSYEILFSSLDPELQQEHEEILSQFPAEKQEVLKYFLQNLRKNIATK